MTTLPPKKGYPRKILEDSVEIDNDILCGSCEELLRKPVQASCGHRFCENCFNSLVEESDSNSVICPPCSREKNAIVNINAVPNRDRNFQRRMDKLKVVCANEGCTWKGYLFQYDQSHEKECSKMEYDQSHEKACSNKGLIVKTPLSESVKTPAGQHGQQHGQHGQQQLMEHDEIEDMDETGTRTSSNQQHPATTGRRETENSKLELCHRRTENCEGIAMSLTVSLDKLVSKFTEMDNQRKKEIARIAELEKEISSLKNELALKDHVSYNGVLVWKISNWAKKREDAINGTQTSLYSPYFFTSRFGYKMRARIYPNGDGGGKKEYVSLFFVVMRSQYDAFLTWPFKQKVTLTMLDQTPNQEHIYDAFRPDLNSSSFQRPVSEMNIASGCPFFVPLSLLTKKEGYTMDDTVFIKIVVDTHGLTHE